MKPIEDQVWPWVVKGFQGLTGMIRFYVDSGLPPTEYLRKELAVVRGQINEILERIGEPKTP